MKPPTVFLGEMTTLEVEEFLKEHHTVIIPVGATEQHGPHGPLLTDVLIPQEVARRAAPRLNAVVAPPVNYALSYPHVGFKGLVYMRIPTFMSMIEDLAAAFGAVGFKRIIFLNGHYDNTYALAYACANAAERLPEDARAYPLNYWDGMPPEVREKYSSLREGDARQRRRDVGDPGDQPEAGGHGEGERRVPELPRVHRQLGAGAHGVLLLEPAVRLLGDEIGHVGRCPIGESADRRGLHQRGRRLDDCGDRERREDVRRDPRRP